MESGAGERTDLHDEALRSLKKKQGFKAHVATYLCVNVFLVVIWAVAGAGFFWPVFPIFGWGIGLAANAWDVYGRKPITQEDVEREAERLRARGAAVKEPGEPGGGGRPVP